jgi:predicted RNA-binding protein with PUA-like domain
MPSTPKQRYWLMKSEPMSYSIEHLKKDGETPWTGVRNYQARNFMKEMKKGDMVLFYHSSCEVPGIYGVAKVSKEAEPDETQFDKKGHYYEPRAIRDKPMWECATIKFVKAFKKPIPLPVMRIDPILSGMHVMQKGSRLSVTPVSEREFERVEEIIK